MKEFSKGQPETHPYAGVNRREMLLIALFGLLAVSGLILTIFYEKDGGVSNVQTNTYRC